MSSILLASCDDEWTTRIREAFGGTLNGDLRTTKFTSLDIVDGMLTELGTSDSELLVVGPDVGVDAALGIAQAVDEQRPDVSVVLIAEPSSELLEQAVRVGVRDVIDPLSSLEILRSSIDRAIATVARRRAVIRNDLAPRTDTAKVITVVSPKGGAGKTAISSNLAVGLANHAPNEVVILDLDLQFGDVANALRLAPEQTLSDLVRVGTTLDPTTVKAFLTPHPSGLFALCAPESPAEADGVTVETIASVIELLRDIFAYVVIDTAAGLDESTLMALEHATDILCVCATDVASARGLRKEVEAFDILGITEATRHFVVNRSDARVGLTIADIERTVGLDVAVSIPSSRSIPTSMNQGSPVLESEPRSQVGRAFGELTARFVRAATPAAQPAPTGLFRRMKESR